MKNQTIIILKDSDGEHDSYYEYVTDVYIVPRKKFDFQLEYNKYLFQKLKERTQINVEWRIQPNGSEGMFYPKPLKKAEVKLVNEIIREFDEKTFLETVYKAKRIDSFIEHLK